MRLKAVQKSRSIIILFALLTLSVSRGQPAAARQYLDGIQYAFTRWDNVKILGGSFLLSMAALQVDQQAKEYAQDNGLMPETLARIGDGFGGNYGHWILLGGQTLDYLVHKRSKDVFQDEITYSLAALSFNGIVTVMMKEAVGRERPNGKGNRSYPSGHTSHSFTIATICQELYGPKIGIPAYGMAVLVALSRIHDNKHYLSDVIMGAGLGTAIGRGFAGSYVKEYISVSPVSLGISIPL